MSDVTNIIRAVGLILTLSEQFAGVVREWNGVIRQARREGRDITDDELRDLRQRSRSALDRWLGVED